MNFETHINSGCSSRECARTFIRRHPTRRVRKLKHGIQNLLRHTIERHVRHAASPLRKPRDHASIVERKNRFSLTEKIFPANRTVGVRGVGAHSVHLAVHREVRSSRALPLWRSSLRKIPRRSFNVNVTFSRNARRSSAASHRTTFHRAVLNGVAVYDPRTCDDRDRHVFRRRNPAAKSERSQTGRTRKRARTPDRTERD